MNQIHHIAIICSSDESVEFYENLGFIKLKQINRGNDYIVLLSGYDICLELFVDNKHPQRLTAPEALGLRHFAIKVYDFNDMLEKYADVIIKTDWYGERYFVIFDPDGLPIEIHE